MLILANPTAGRVRASSVCPPRDGHVIKSSGLSRVYRVGGDVFACQRGHTAVKLGTDLAEDPDAGPSADFVTQFALTSMRIAYLHQIDSSESLYLIERRNLVTRQRLASVPTGGQFCARSGCTSAGMGPASAVAANAAGDVAYIAYSIALKRNEVWAISAGRTRRLAVGTDIAATALTVNDARVSWREGGTARSWQLPHRSAVAATSVRGRRGVRGHQGRSPSS